MGLARAGAVVAGLMIAAATEGAELELSMGSGVEYQTNVFRDKTNNNQDGANLRFTPSIGLHEAEQNYDYRLEYRSLVRVFTSQTDATGVSHFATGSFDYLFSPRASISFVDNFSSVENVDLNTQDTPDVDLGRTRTTQNRATLTTGYAFSPRTSGSWSAWTSFYDVDESNRSNNLQVGTTLSAQYSLTPRQQVGGGGSFTLQMFEATPSLPEADTYISQLFGLWNYQIDEKTDFSFNAGPALFVTEQTRAGRSATDSTFTFLGGLDLERRWTPHLTSALSYQRTQGTGQGTGGSTIRDSVVLGFNWQPATRWNFNLRGDWVQRTSSTDVARVGLGRVSDDVDTQTWRVSTGATYDISKNLSASLNASYRIQDNQGTTATFGRDAQDTDNFRAFLQVRYHFDPIRVW